MSKMDGLRAMREARYEAAAARAKEAGVPRRADAPKPSVRPAKASPAPPPATASAEALCGHRNMGGRTCTREEGHAAKSHRYS